MNISIREFIKKYKLDDFSKILELKGEEKLEFYSDLNKILRGISRIFDKLANIESLRGGQVLLALAKLEKSEQVINKTDVKNCLDIDRLDKLSHAFDYLQEKGFIDIDEKTPKFHILNLDLKNNPDLKIFKEIIEKFWVAPEEMKKELTKWSERK
ncbi:MAG: hypothetical protein BAJALOKI2v1_120020 [Promethearchaeota archaeon]|nr:MAG: hypothetical protein BAJALOKI2v1_120020 [Candidatus Lokiarchaeota archaeon]